MIGRPVPRRRAERPRGRRRVRALLSLGVVLGVGAVTTAAYFSDEATLGAGSFQTGTLDLTLDQGVITPNLTVDALGGSVVKASLGISAMLPGESVAAHVLVRNDADAGFTYKANGALGDSTFPTAAPVRLTFAVHAGTASNSGTAAAGNRSGSCSGTLLYGPAVLTSTAVDVIGTARSLTSGQSENVCVVVRLDPLADNTYQGKTATASFVFRATQVGQAP